MSYVDKLCHSPATDLVVTDTCLAGALQESELLDGILQTSRALIFVLDLDGRIVRLNHAVERLCGRSADEMIGRSYVQALVPERDRVLAEGAIMKALDSLETRGMIFPILNREGDERMVEWSSRVLHDHEGEPIGFLWTGEDITERRDLEERLRLRDTELPIFTYGPIPMILLDSDRRVHRVNRAAVEFAEHHPYAGGRGTGTILSCLDFRHEPKGCRNTHSSNDCVVRRIVRDTFEQGASYERVEAGIEFADGDARHELQLLVSTTPLSVGGRPMVLVCLEDVTDLKRAQDDATRERDRARKYLAVAEVILRILNDKGEIVLLNQKGCRLLGYSEEELLGRKWIDQFVPPEVRKEVHSAYDKLMAEQSGGYEYHENPVLNRSGERRLIAWHSTALTDSKGKVTGVLSCGEDITDHRRDEEELRRLHQQLRRQNDDLEELLFAAGHDLRAPVLNVLGYGKRLASALKDVPPELEIVIGSAKRLDAMLMRLVELSRLGRDVLHVTRLDVRAMLASVVAVLESQIGAAGAELSIGELPPCLGDEAQVREVLFDLLHNAIKYRDPSRPCRVRINGWKEQGQAIYCVEDNGIGIAPEHHERIFQIFYQLDPANTTGEGMGLPIARHALQRLGGRIWVESEPGKGSRFLLSLPAAE